MLQKLYHKLWSTVEKKFKKTSFVDSSNIESQLNILYGEDIKNNCFDVHIPSNTTTKTPTIFMIHGGGYTSGTKEGSRNFCQILASKGYLVFNVEYTKCDNEEHKYFPDQIYEFFKFYKCISSNPEYEKLIDFDNIYLAGNSAGAHIAALIANIQTNPELKINFNLQGGPQVKGVIFMSPSFGAYKFAGLYPKTEYHNVIFGKKEYRNLLCALSHNLDVTTESFPPCVMFSAKGDFVVGAHKHRFLNLAKELNLSVHHYNICTGYKLFHSSMLCYADKYPVFIEKVDEFLTNACNNIFAKGVVDDQIFEDISKENCQFVEIPQITTQEETFVSHI